MNHNSDKNDLPKGRFARSIRVMAEWAQRHNRLMFAIQIAALILIVVLAYVVLTVPEFRDYFSGYLGAFVVNLIASATIVLPAPGLLITCTFATPSIGLNIWLLSLFAAAGATTGEMVAYLLGYSGAKLLTGPNKHPRTEQLRVGLTKWYSGPILFILAFSPLPLFDIAGILAGAIRMNVLYFLFWVFLGKLLKFTLLGWVCFYGTTWLRDLLVDGLFNWIASLFGG